MHLAALFEMMKEIEPIIASENHEMLIKTILNRIEKFKSFVYGPCRLEDRGAALALLVDITARANGRPVCSGCGKRRAGYDTLPARRFQYVPFWGIAVFFLYAMRRVNCPECGVVVEKVPWADGKERITTRYAWFLADWAKRLTWAEVARTFHTTWNTVFRSVSWAVFWGLVHRKFDDVRAIGVDEVLFHRGHEYLTVVYQIDENRKRLLWVGEDRTQETLRRFFMRFGSEATERLEFICSDMWGPYVDVIAEKAPQVLHILDRYHIASNVNKAVNKVRAEEARRMEADGYEPVLKNARWCLLKRPENLTDAQEAKLRDLLRYNLKSVRAYLLKEDLDGFWTYVSPTWAGKFLDRWCKRAMRSRIEPMKRIARMLRKRKSLLLNWFKARARISLGATEGLNNKEKVVMRSSYGFRVFKVAEVALYHKLGDLPEPEFAHKFL
jgi:transposase